MDVDAMDLDELRIAIAEQLGWHCKTLKQIRAQRQARLGPGRKLRDGWVPQCRFWYCTIDGKEKRMASESAWHPERDIAAAMGLVVDMPDFILSCRTAGWECTGRLCWSGRAGFTHITARDGKPVCICAVGKGDTPAEAISRAWLKAST